jgi:shikimate kinase|tara:strand:- start:2649 stop:3161 length:513 start_codon:yes stop_codon:yes gene_type:complete
MKSKKNLVFLGMMGSGKSSIGLLVSKKLNINFIDIDNEIEKKLKMKIKNIFEIKGENYFRKVEEDMTLKVLNNIRNVISLGGGGFLNKQIRKEVLDNHISFWLNWKSKTLLKRIKDSKKRPIAIKSSKNELAKLIKERSIVYSKALYKIDCEGLSKLEIANYILKIYENN